MGLAWLCRITVLILVASDCHSVGADSFQETSGIERLRRLVDEASVSSKVAAYQPKAKGRIDDLNTAAEPILRQVPWVVEVKTAVSGVPQCRIVHLKDWHFIPLDLFAADIRDQAKGPISEAEIDRLYEEFLLEVELVETTKILSGMKEGSPEHRKAMELREAIEALLHTHRLDLLRIGAAGQLWMTGELQDVLPLDRESALERANPLAGEQGIELDSATIESVVSSVWIAAIVRILRAPRNTKTADVLRT